MPSKRQMLVRLDTGEQIVFDLDGANDYVQFAYDVDSLWKTWVRVGPNAVIRKSRVTSFYYFPYGYNNNQSGDTDGQDDTQDRKGQWESGQGTEGSGEG